MFFEKVSKMDLRARALLTRVQTMRTSTMVALGVLVGLVLIFYIKETNYRKRVIVKKGHPLENRVDHKGNKLSMEDANYADLTDTLESGGSDIQRGEDDELITDSTSTAMTPTTTTAENYEYSNNADKNDENENHDDKEYDDNDEESDYDKYDNEEENKFDDKEEDNDNDDNTDMSGNENGKMKETVNNDDVSTTTQFPTTTESYEDDEAANVSSDKADEKLKVDINQIPKYIETTHDKQEQETVVEAKPQIIQMKIDLPEVPVEKIQNVQKDNVRLLDILGKETQFLKAQAQLRENNFLPNDQININTVQNKPILETEQTVNLNNVPYQRVERDIRNGMVIDSNIGPAVEDNQVQMLASKYSTTLNETDLPRQNEPYTKRLRNKLVQTGRYDLIDSKDCKKKLPTALIIGVMKAGTEAFSTFLGVHPQVAMQFGYAAMVFFSSSQFKNGYEWYRERMMCSVSDQVTMEKSPQYFSSPVAPRRIHDMNPDMKLIILVRDPVSRALSHFLQQKSSNPDRLKAPTFEECVYNKHTKRVIADSPYVLQSTYSVILKRWLQYFPYKQILIIDGDTFKMNPTRSLHKAETFLGIDNSFSKDRLYFNKEKGFYCLKINSTLAEDLEMSCFGSEKGRPHPAIEPEVESALLDYFRPYNEEFTKITGMQMRWKK